MKTAQAQWAVLGLICALHGLTPQRLTHADLDAGRDALLAAADRRGGARPHLSTAVFGLEATLFHAGVTDELPRKRGTGRGQARQAAWARVSPVMRATMQDYLAQVSTTLRPGRVKNSEATLREFAGFVVEHDPAARRVADLGRRHVEAYKCWLAERPAARGGPLHRHTIKDRLCALRGFFTRLLEWEIADAPVRVPVLASDLPIPDQPLPRFLDDAAATKLLQAARADADPFVRLTVEFLARTGLRKGEYLALTTDAVVHRLGLLAARAGRQAAHRPLHPATPTAQTAARPVADPPAAGAALEAHFRRARSAAARVTGGRRGGQGRPSRRDRERLTPPAPAHPGHPSDQPRHVAGGDRGLARELCG